MRVTLDRLPPGFRSKWRASAELFGVMFCAYGNTKDEAVESIRPKLLDYKQYFSTRPKSERSSSVRVEITVERSIPAWWQPDDRWFARAEFDGKIFTEYGYTKRGSVRALKAQLKEYRELLDDLAKGTETHVVEL